jgi:hypothetical protein
MRFAELFPNRGGLIVVGNGAGEGGRRFATCGAIAFQGAEEMVNGR